jgi:glycosyltransferase involved in cell wall biosynthesis
VKITVAVPCYNGAAYVGRTIESLLNQSRSADEILVVDDGSTDESAEIARRYPVKLVQHEHNAGLSAARNTAIAAATGEILAFIDVDAFADRDWLKVLLSGYNNDVQVGGVGGQGVEVNVHSLADRWRRAHASQGHGDRPKDVEFLFGLCMSFRLDALREVGGFNEAFRTNGEDVEIGIRLNAAGYRLRYLPGAKVYHQRTDDESSLERTMMAWCTAAYQAKCVNHHQPWRVFAGTLRRIVVDPLSDLVVRRDPAMARLSWQIGWKKLYALWRTIRELES